MFLEEGTLGRGAIPALFGFLISAGGLPLSSSVAWRRRAPLCRTQSRVGGIVVIIIWLVYNMVRRPGAVDAPAITPSSTG